jgi:hypothetical protein
MERDIERA